MIDSGIRSSLAALDVDEDAQRTSSTRERRRRPIQATPPRESSSKLQDVGRTTAMAVCRSCSRVRTVYPVTFRFASFLSAEVSSDSQPSVEGRSLHRYLSSGFLFGFVRSLSWLRDIF